MRNTDRHGLAKDGAPCCRCRKRITRQGIHYAVHYHYFNGTVGFYYYHLDCAFKGEN